jgi:hypothetical protein
MTIAERGKKRHFITGDEKRILGFQGGEVRENQQADAKV